MEFELNNRRRLMITPILLVLALAIAWIYSSQISESEVAASKGEVALKTWLKQQGWSYFLQAQESQCQILVSKPVVLSLAEEAEDIDRACLRLLIKLQVQQVDSQAPVSQNSMPQASD